MIPGEGGENHHSGSCNRTLGITTTARKATGGVGARGALVDLLVAGLADSPHHPCDPRIDPTRMLVKQLQLPEARSHILNAPVG